MSILILQILNSLYYASVLFLIAAGLSLIFGVMRIINMAHGSFYAIGAYATAWMIGARGRATGCRSTRPVHPDPGRGPGGRGCIGAVIEPLLLRPFYRRAEEYQLLVTFGLLLILQDASAS